MDIKTPLRVLHSAALLRPPNGILKQMGWELEAAQELDLSWDVKMYCPLNSTVQSDVTYFEQKIDSNNIKSKVSKVLAWVKLRREYHKWLLSLEEDTDIFILRYYVHDPFQLWFVRRCNKPIYFMHHSLEVPELAMPGNINAIIRSKLESFIGRLTLPYAKGIIGVTDEIIKHEQSRILLDDKPTHLYPNGIIYQKELFIEDKRSSDVPELLFVANFAPWHGLDLLIESVKTNENDFILHLVGNIPDELKDITKSDSRIVVHDSLKHSEIIELSQKCWIGLGTFALKRKQMKQACPLKVREYLMLGLPVYGDCTDIFPLSSIFYKTGDENITNILAFAKKTRHINKTSLHREVKKYIDKKILLKNLYNEIRLDLFNN